MFTVFQHNHVSNKITANKRNKCSLIGLNASPRNFTKCQSNDDVMFMNLVIDLNSIKIF